jgi:ATP-dependent DNA ligase
VVFDALQLAGEPLTGLPWHERRSALEAALLVPRATISVIDVFDADPALHARLVALGFEGSVAQAP